MIDFIPVQLIKADRQTSDRKSIWRGERMEIETETEAKIVEHDDLGRLGGKSLIIRTDTLNMIKIGGWNHLLIQCMETISFYQERGDLSENLISELKKSKTLADKIVNHRAKLRSEEALKKVAPAIDNADAAYRLYGLCRKLNIL